MDVPSQFQMPQSPKTPGVRCVVASLALNAAVFGVLLYQRSPRLMPVSLPGDHEGHLQLLTYAPHGRQQTSTVQPRKTLVLPTPPGPTAKATPTPRLAASAAMAPSQSTSTATTAGADALGDGNMTIAFVDVHPPPHPDLSKLPTGTRGDVIVDVVIDQNGRITKSSLTHGLGHGVDEIVLATIQRWTFRPATRNGQPVASEQELLFHYERG